MSIIQGFKVDIIEEKIKFDYKMSKLKFRLIAGEWVFTFHT